MNQKVTPESFDAYRAWQKYILSTHPKLPTGFKRATLVAYALAMAIKGTNGLDCFASDSTIAGELEIYRRGLIGNYRRLALELGWFVRTGKRRGRAEVLRALFRTLLLRAKSDAARHLRNFATRRMS